VSLIGCADPSTGDGDPTGDGDSTGDGDPTGDGDGDPTGDGDGDSTGDGDSIGDGVPYRAAGVLWAEVGRIRLALYDNESGWDDPIDVNLPEHHWIDSALRAVAAIEDTGVTVLWDHNVTGPTQVWARRYNQDLGWESPVEIDPSTPFRFVGDIIALPDGQTLAIWRQSQTLDNGTYTVTYSCRDQNVWGPVVATDKYGIEVRSRQDGTLVVFDVDGPATQIVAQVFDQGGGSEWCSQPLGGPTPLNPTISSPRMVKVEDQGGPLIHAVWRADDSKQVEAAHFDPETLTWSTPTLLPSMVNYPVPGGGATILAAEDAASNAWVVSNDVSTANMRLHVHRFDAELGTWSDTLLLDEPDHELSNPALAVTPDDDVFVAAQINETGVDGMREIIGFAWDHTDQSWSEPIALGITNESYSDTLVEIEPVSGDVFVTWTHDDDVHLTQLDARTQIWSERVFPTAFDQHSVRYLHVLGDGEVLLILQDTTFDFPNSTSTITALVHDAAGWGPTATLVSNARVTAVRPFAAQH